ncbi:MAG: adenylyl-sulfate kinase [Verrucomicrobiaceae bacterium]|nr:adenylyl-sulfate kinase [Verrucomicrobiaceae bacterium]
MPQSLLPEFQVSRSDREQMLQQRGLVVWLFGLSGAGKSTLANELGQSLHKAGKLTLHLDGDILRGGLNQGLGFTKEDRLENIRRAAEVAKLSVQSGCVVICSFITPLEEMRGLVREIIHKDDLLEVYVRCSFATCANRDVKGLYKAAAANQVANFTGKDSLFEEPKIEPGLTLNTEKLTVAECTQLLASAVNARATILPGQ